MPKRHFEYHDAKEFLIIGRGFQNTGYSRLPSSYKEKLRPEVWNLSLHSSGIAIRFTTNSSTIDLKWKTGAKSRFPHAAETLIKGVDLYGMQNGKWFFAGVGKPYDPENNQYTSVKGMDTTMKDLCFIFPCMKLLIPFLSEWAWSRNQKTIRKWISFFMAPPLHRVLQPCVPEWLILLLLKDT